MIQNRSITGIRFEKEICEKLGWKQISKSPKIVWTGSGRTNFDKMINHFNNGTDMLIDETKSNFDKYDAIDENYNKIEVKKYDSNNCLDWILYSEPLIKIATNGQITKITKLFGNGDFELARTRYNQIIKKIFDNNKDIVLKYIKNSNIGIRFNDKFVSNQNLEFRIVLIKSWKGFYRATIQFKLKSD